MARVFASLSERQFFAIGKIIERHDYYFFYRRSLRDVFSSTILLHDTFIYFYIFMTMHEGYKLDFFLRFF